MRPPPPPPPIARLFRRPASWLLALLMCCCAAGVTAHDARPAAVTIEEELEHVYRYEVRVPPSVDPANIPVLVWPQTCRSISGEQAEGGAMVCPGGLEGQPLSLDYPRFNPSLATWFRLTDVAGQSSTALLSPTEAAWIVPREPGRAGVAVEYLRLGIAHIIGGADHLLFVLGLLVIARTGRRILLTVTGFTLAHSITLSLSSLGWLRVPIMPVEAGIALSILFLAHEISRGRRDSLSWRYPLLVSFGFGLLHGLGFASALGEIGLVPSEVVVSLLFFNLGVEAGQIAFIVAVMAVIWLLGRTLGRRHVGASHGAITRGRLELLAAYAIGIPSAYWLIDRVAGFAL